MSCLDSFTNPLAFTLRHLLSNPSPNSSTTSSSFGIVFGCTDDDFHRLETMLNATETAFNHPLFLIFTFTDTVRTRLEGITKTIVASAGQVSQIFEVLRAGSIDEKPSAVLIKVRQVHKDTNIFEEDLTADSR